MCEKKICNIVIKNIDSLDERQGENFRHLDDVEN